MRPEEVVEVFFLGVLGLMMVSIIASFGARDALVEPEVVEVEVERVVHLSHPLTAIRLERVSAYNAVPRQTDDDPSTASCGTTIPGTVALSQDLFFREDGHKYRCGQRVTILTDRGEVFPNLVVWDTMSPRYSLTADVLWPNNNEDEAFEFGISEGWLVFH